LKSICKDEEAEGTHQLEIDTGPEQLNSGLYNVIFHANSFSKSLLLNIIK